MPYTIKKNSSGKYCVHKANADGEPVGDPISKCHATPKEAGKQISAIEHSEDKEKSMAYLTNNFFIAPADAEGLSDIYKVATTSRSSDVEFYWYEHENDGTIIKKKIEPNVGGGVDRDKLKGSDFVFPGERKFPVVIPKDVKDAVNSWGRYKGKQSFESFKRKLTALAKRKGKKFVAALPDDWKKNMKKSFSLDEYRENINSAWSQNEKDSWISEIYDDFVIAYNPKTPGYEKVPYTANEDGSDVQFSSERVDVKLKKEWIKKAFSRINYSEFVSETDEQTSSDSGYAIKALGENRVGSYGILWGDDERKDLHSEYFTEKTKDLTAIFDVVGAIPFIVHHAKDDEVVKFVAGVVDIMVADSKGLWWEAKITELETYKEYVQPLLERDALFSSSGTLPAAKRVEKSGEITRWPVAEMSGTWLPAEYRMLEVPITEIKSVYSELGLDTKFMAKFDNNNDEPTNQDTNDTKGAEKAQLKTWIDLKFVELGLLEIEN